MSGDARQSARSDAHVRETRSVAMPGAAAERALEQCLGRPRRHFPATARDIQQETGVDIPISLTVNGKAVSATSTRARCSCSSCASTCSSPAPTSAATPRSAAPAPCT